jgi:hypothetical protein
MFYFIFLKRPSNKHVLSLTNAYQKSRDLNTFCKWKYRLTILFNQKADTWISVKITKGFNFENGSNFYRKLLLFHHKNYIIRNSRPEIVNLLIFRVDPKNGVSYIQKRIVILNTYLFRSWVLPKKFQQLIIITRRVIQWMIYFL